MLSPRLDSRLVAVLAVSAALSAGDAVVGQAEGGEPFGETVAVRVVNVDVWVSDRQGRPVTGLTRDDFVLYEDGVEVAIANFYAVATARREAEASERIAVEPGPVLPLLVTGQEAIHAVLYLDGNTLGLADRAGVVDDLRAFAERNAGREVRFTVVSAGFGVKMETPFTGDPGVVEAALERLAAGAPPADQEVREYRRAIDTLQRLLELGVSRAACADDGCRTCPADLWPTLVQAWETYAVSSSFRTRTAIDNLAELVSSLGGIPGRKALFFVSSGIQQRPGLGLLQYLGELCTNFQRESQALVWRFDETSSLQELAARANANRVTLHTLDAGGLRKSDATDVAYGGVLARPSALVGEVRKSNLQSSLFVLAEQTGGQAIFNANEPLADLDRLLGEQRAGYSLGFSPARPPDGETHRLKVALRTKLRGAEVRYRRSYRDKPDSEKLGDRLMASLHLGVEDNPLGVTASMGSPTALERRRFEVPLVIRMPAERLSWIPTGGRVRVFLAAEDAAGQRTPLREELIELGGATGDGKLPHEIVVTMELRSGPHRVALGVRDEIAGVVSLLRLEIDVGGPGAAAEPLGAARSAGESDDPG